MKKNQKGFSLVELLIYIGLTAMIMGLFASILVTVTRLGGEQNNSTQVTSELNFLMSAIKQRIRDTSSVSNITSSTLSLRTYTNPTQLTVFTFTDNKINLQEEGTLSQLSANNIVVDSLTFTDLSNASSQSIQIVIQISNNTNNINKVTRVLQATATPLLLAQ